MTAARILTQAQAEATYSAMCALNSVSHSDGFRISFFSTIDGCVVRINVEETDVDMIRVSYHDGRITHCEHHEGQSAFAAAYGLDGKEPRAAVYTAGIGWQVQDKYGRSGNFETEAEALSA